MTAAPDTNWIRTASDDELQVIEDRLEQTWNSPDVYTSGEITSRLADLDAINAERARREDMQPETAQAERDLDATVDRLVDRANHERRERDPEVAAWQDERETAAARGQWGIADHYDRALVAERQRRQPEPEIDDGEWEA